MKVSITFMNDIRGTDEARRYNDNGEELLVEIFSAQSCFGDIDGAVDNLEWSVGENALSAKFASNAKALAIVNTLQDKLGTEEHDFHNFAFKDIMGKTIESLSVVIIPKP